MFSSGPNYTKLKTNLRLAINRLKLIEKKKTELAQKSRKEIADYIQAGKTERAKIRVECIIREDYLVEAMELVEMFCDLILARFGLVQQMKELDGGLAEAVSSILWVAPRLQSDIQEMKIIADLLTAKYGKQYYEACRSDNVATINEKLKRKISVSTPPKILVEKYMIEIAKNYDILYEPDPEVMKEDTGIDALLNLNLDDTNDLSGGNGGGMGGMGFPQPAGFIGYPQPPMLPQSPNYTPFNYPPQINSNSPNAPYGGGFVVPGTSGIPNAPPPSVPYGAPYSYNIPPHHELEKKDLNTNLLMSELPPNYDSVSPDDNSQNLNSNNGANPKPQPRSKFLPDKPKDTQSIPNLPNVPSDLPDLPVAPEDEVDFDDLTRRFEELKKKK